MVSRTVCCRVGASCLPPVNTASRWLRRPSKVWGDSSLLRAAASSRERGSPSSWIQIWAIAAALSEDKTNWGFTICARCTNRATAAYCASSSCPGRWCGSGKESGGTENSYSPSTCSTARLVTRILLDGQASSSSTSAGAASRTCSKLSSSNRRCLSCRNALSDSKREYSSTSRTEGLCNTGYDQVKVAERSKLHQADALSKYLVQIRRNLTRQACLADAGRTGEGEQPDLRP